MPEQFAVVTGGSGFIGRHLVRQLDAQGARVRVLDLREPADLPRQVDFVQGSILDEPTVVRALDKATHLYHLAANPNLWVRDKHDLHRTNYEGTVTILKAARTANLQRLIYTSTETILKGTKKKSDVPITEDTPLPELDELPGAYSRSKMLADRAVRSAAEEGLPAVLVNPTVPVGEGDINFTPPTKMIHGFVSGATPAYLDCVLNLVAVQDVARGHILAGEKGQVGHRYLLCGHNVRLGEVLELLEEITGRPMPKNKVPFWLSYTVGVVSEFMSNYVTRKPPVAPLEGVRVAGTVQRFDGSKTREELDLTVTPLKQALSESVAWLERDGHLV